MPKTIKLSWQPGVGSRDGRWKKVYRGKAYYFPGGTGKSDREGYDAAWAAWQVQKAEIDRAGPRKHQGDYEVAIEVWEQVLAWSNRYGERQVAAVAYEKLEVLRKRLLIPVLEPLARDDTFDAVLDVPTISLDDIVANPPTAAEIAHLRLPGPVPAKLTTHDLERLGAGIDGSPSRIVREIWQDRLEIQQRKAASEDDSLGAHVLRFLTQKGDQASAGEVSIGRVNGLRIHLTWFQDWLGKDTAVRDIDGAALTRCHAELLHKVSKQEWNRTTANHYMASVKGFVRWLWQIEAIPSLPRVLDGRSQLLRISRPSPRVIVFTKEEIKQLLADASDRTKLYILLMLNCGMTQKDIADLLVDEVEWQEGRIIRKRSKTGDCENVPEVNYKLWPETSRLLQQERAADSRTLVLVNSNGHPLWSEVIGENGKFQKTDNIKNAFDRLRKSLTIEKPLKSLKKTSATLLRDNERFSGLAGLFLGHAPQSMSDKHYTQVPQKLLDQAVEWLGQEYGL